MSGHNGTNLKWELCLLHSSPKEYLEVRNSFRSLAFELVDILQNRETISERGIQERIRISKP